MLQRGLGAIYLLAFLSAWQQFQPLLGANGLQPIPSYLQGRTFWQVPSLFHLGYSDRRFAGLCLLGMGLSAAALFGWLDSGPVWVSMVGWLILWALYTSIVNVGQRFYGFGWESMLLEAGFFVAFLGPGWTRPSWVPLWALRWMLFRVEFGAGLIKLRHDSCWRDLTCLEFHYETQPMPNPLSWHFHHFPRWLHRLGVLGSHVIQVVVPFGLFLPQPWAGGAAGLMAFHQFWLIVSGNYAWLNWLTVVLCFCAIPGGSVEGAARPLYFDALLLLILLMTLRLSEQPARNLASKQQKMNFSWNRWRLVNSYGAFGSVSRERFEIVLEGTNEPFPSSQEDWLQYEFWGKPGDPRRRPLQFAPYHLRLDWVIWFVPLSLGPTLQRGGPDDRRLAWRYDHWFLLLIQKLLDNDPRMLRLFRLNPFPEKPPLFVRAVVYHYRYTTPGELRESGAWWVRRRVGIYLPAQTSTRPRVSLP